MRRLHSVRVALVLYVQRADGGEQGFDFLSRRRPGMQDRGGVRVRRRMDKSRTVPTDQQPFNELQELKEDPLFGWAQEDSKGLVTRLALIYAVAMAVSIPIGTTTFPNQLPEALLAANIGGLGVLLAVAIRLYSGWNYVSVRLGAEVVEYEESGWYDGSEWYKPPDIRARDEMLNNYEVQPAVDRLKAVLAAIGLGFMLTVVGFKVVVPDDPYAMLDETYLNTLKGDDDIANDAAKKAAARGTNRPVYCESRYYQAMAGGGLCDK
ncbi:unnamed protein product [Ectocarpus sp. 4 AP-2014]